MAAVVSITAGVLVFFPFPGGLSGSAITTLTRIREVEEIKLQIARINTDIEALRTDIQAISRVPEQSQVAGQLNRLEGSVAGLQTRQMKLEQVILDNPAKALEMPLLRRDVESLRNSQQENLVLIRQSIDRVYDQNKWFIGAILVSIIGLAISTYLTGKRTGQSKG